MTRSLLYREPSPGCMVVIHFFTAGCRAHPLTYASFSATLSKWATAVFNAMEAFKDGFCCIRMEQRNANGGVHRADSRRRRLGRIRGRSAGADGPPRDPEVLLHGLLHRRTVRPQAHRASPRPGGGRRAVPAGRASAGGPRRDVQLPARCLGARAAGLPAVAPAATASR